MKEYTSPEIEIVLFHTEDIITASSTGSGTGGSGSGSGSGGTAGLSVGEALIPPVIDAGSIFYGG